MNDDEPLVLWGCNKQLDIIPDQQTIELYYWNFDLFRGVIVGITSGGIMITSSKIGCLNHIHLKGHWLARTTTGSVYRLHTS